MKKLVWILDSERRFQMLVGFEFISKILLKQEGAFLTVIVPLKPLLLSFYLLLPPSLVVTQGQFCHSIKDSVDIVQQCSVISCVFWCFTFGQKRRDDNIWWSFEGWCHLDVGYPTNPHTLSHEKSRHTIFVPRVIISFLVCTDNLFRIDSFVNVIIVVSTVNEISHLTINQDHHHHHMS